MELLIKITVFLPLLAAILVGLNTKKLTSLQAQLITTVSVVASAILSWVILKSVILEKQTYLISVVNWVNVGDFNANWQLKIDALTAIMLTLVNTVSALVHLYSIGYMSHDEYRQRFMAYLSLFTFCMLMLVTSNNLLQLFFGWEGVGLCSYLLIGFWYEKPSANAAAMKAFIVNRVGDFGLAIGLFSTYLLFGSIEFKDIFAKAGELTSEEFVILGHHFNAITFICIALFIGAMGKSAQLGLHTWLPDAMEGPTPVSALIHAATMVTAGVFLVARFSPVFEYSETALNMVTIVGATTAIFAATIALTQNDIKKIIAYSTCSQLGYMFFACGVSAYAAGIFHLYTHGFFKALLFLSAGSVIHAMSDEQDIKKMGALWNKIPLTYIVMLIGTLAITGFPYLSGYYSKDLILEASYAKSLTGSSVAKYAFWVGIAAATLTAFYSWRLIFLTFHGKFRNSDEVREHVHESPAVMTIPLIILAAGAVFAGYVFAEDLGIGHKGLKFWNGAIKEHIIVEDTGVKCVKAPCKEAKKEVSIYTAAHHIPENIKRIPMIVGAVGFILAFVMYILMPRLPDALARMFRPLYLLSYNKWYIDEIYDLIFVRPAICIGNIFWKLCDTKLVDGMPNGLAFISEKFGRAFKALQSGYIYHYSSVMLIGIISVVGYLIYIF